jgi:hypothetical protein
MLFRLLFFSFYCLVSLPGAGDGSVTEHLRPLFPGKDAIVTTEISASMITQLINKRFMYALQNINSYICFPFVNT